MAKKLKKQEELNNEETSTEITDQATEAVVKAIKAPVKHDINACGCHECEIARDQGAK